MDGQTKGRTDSLKQVCISLKKRSKTFMNKRMSLQNSHFPVWEFNNCVGKSHSWYRSGGEDCFCYNTRHSYHNSHSDGWGVWGTGTQKKHYYRDLYEHEKKEPPSGSTKDCHLKAATKKVGIFGPLIPLVAIEFDPVWPTEVVFACWYLCNGIVFFSILFFGGFIKA